MGHYLLRRSLALVPLLWTMATLVWVVLIVLPGDPARGLLGQTATKEAIVALHQELGLDQPRAVQYFRYLARLARLDLHESLVEGRPVREILLERMWPSAVLAITAITLAVLLGLAGGIAAALRPGGLPDRAVLLLSLVGLAVPVFWMGILLRRLFSGALGWLPINGYTLQLAPAARLFGVRGLEMPDLPNLVLPALTLCAFSAGYFTRLVRTSLCETLTEDFIRTARAKGVPTGRLVLQHALGSALAPLATAAGVQVAMLFGGAIATEILFDWPGIGSALLEGIRSRDRALVSGCVLVLTLTFAVVNLCVDLLYGWLDPRARLLDRG
jgi:peptide/nickel transport system permease protein